jgi:hypothetical protein
MKKRFLRVALRYGILLFVGLAYYLFVSLTNIGIPCLFRLVTGLQCPGCGISRMLIALVRLDLVSAFRCNPAVFLTGPLVLFFLVRSDVDYIRTGKSSANKYQTFWIAELVLLLGFGIVRNLI